MAPNEREERLPGGVMQARVHGQCGSGLWAQPVMEERFQKIEK
jgi:hypothetical protein